MHRCLLVVKVVLSSPGVVHRFSSLTGEALRLIGKSKTIYFYFPRAE